jgi:hypothetical protein
VVEVAIHELLVGLVVLQLIIQAAATVLSLLVATKGKAKTGYFLAGGMIFFAIHNLLELFTEVENLTVAVTKLISSIFFLYGIWILYESVIRIEHSK